MSKVLIPLFSCLLVGNAHAQGNLVQNGGFESGIDQNWELFGEESNITYSPDAESAIEGVNCLKAELVELGANPWDIQIKNAFGPVEEGHLYKATIWAKSAAGGSTINYTIGKATAGYDEYASAYGVAVSTEWTKYTLEFTAQVSTTNDITLAMHVTGVDTYWFDDFKVVELTGEVNDASVNAAGNRIVLKFAMNLAKPDVYDQLPFFVYSQQGDYQVTGISLSNNATELILELAEPIFEGENITVEYIPGTLRTTAGIEISPFSIDAVNNSEVPNSITNINANDSFTIYPIPFTAQLTIENTGRQSIESIKILDNGGKMVLHLAETFNSNLVQLNLDHLEPGIYYIMIESESGIHSVSKIVKN